MIHTRDAAMREVLRIAETVASSRAAVLIQGESGTGKEMLARYIHQKSLRSQHRMVAINCAAVPENLLESELFGYTKGAFTSAHQAKPGKFELAHQSTFLLDEVSEMPLLLQAKLLRVLQEGEIERIGATQPTRVNVRVIATANRDLRQMVGNGLFREDLYYRLNVIPLEIPPLRQRLADITELASYFLQLSAVTNQKNVKSFSPEALIKLSEWSWPGNIRELQNVVERAVLLAKRPVLTADDLPISGFQKSQRQGFLQPGMTVSEAERELILKTLEHTEQNRTKAATLLGISIRTLRNKLQEYHREEKL